MYELKENFSMKILDEKLLTTYSGVAFPPFDFLYKPFNEIILRAIQAGLIDYWYRSFYPQNYFTWKPKQSEPVVLTWDHVYIGFYIWLICLAVSTVGSISEIIQHRMVAPRKLREDNINRVHKK